MRKLMDKFFQTITYVCAVAVIVLIILVVGHILKESFPAFREVGWGLFDLRGEWRPVSENPKFSLMPVITGTLYVSILGVVLAMIFGTACAFWLNFYLPRKLADLLTAFIDMMAGVPSVIFGFIGLTVFVKGLQEWMDMPAGQCILAAGGILGMLLLPFVVSTCSDSIRYARGKYEFTALALGFSREMVILKVIFPAIGKGLIAAAMMAFGRALGETMAVMMCVGNSAIYPRLLGRGQTIASLTALEMGSIIYGSTHLAVLYAANLILLVMMMVMLFGGWFLKRRIEKAED